MTARELLNEVIDRYYESSLSVCKAVVRDLREAQRLLDADLEAARREGFGAAREDEAMGFERVHRYRDYAEWLAERKETK